MKSPYILAPARLLGVVGLLIALAFGGSAVAGPLEDAKSAGLVGERPDGYVAAVQPNPPANIARLVDDINSKRRAAYEQVAAQTATPVEQVAAVAAEKIRARAGPGEYFMDAGGNWLQQ